MTGAVPLSVPDLRARPWLPATAQPESVWLSPGGDVVRVTRQGVEPVLPGGHPRPGIAADPGAAREVLP